MPALFSNADRQNFDAVRSVRISWSAEAGAFMLAFDLRDPIPADWLLSLSVGLVHATGACTHQAHVDWRESRGKSVKAQLMFDEDLRPPFAASQCEGAPAIREVLVQVHGTKIQRRFAVQRD